MGNAIPVWLVVISVVIGIVALPPYQATTCWLQSISQSNVPYNA
jgi:hypothetical protein